MTRASAELAPLDAPTLVEASAGTGKTHAITTYFVRGILERSLTPEQILVVTYTKAATTELRVRCRKRIVEALACLDEPFNEADPLQRVICEAVERLGRSGVEALLRTALGNMDQASILTIHGFCQRLLQDHPLLFGVDLDFEVAEDTSSMHADLAVDFWATDLYARPRWMLRELARRNVDVDQLTHLARICTMPGVEIVGPEPEDGAEPAVAQVVALHDETARLWAAYREEILATLQNDEGLNRNQYRKDSIANKWIPALDELFQKSGFQPLPDFFAKLAPDHMKVRRGCEKPKHEFFDACGRLHDAHEALAPLLDYEVFAFKQRFIEFVRKDARKRRQEAGVLSFDELLTTVYAPWDPSIHRASSVDPALIAKTIAESYPLALVDEFQDTDSTQYGIFKAIYGEGAIVYVGDPKQAIYAFRGADVFSYIGAAADVEDRDYALTTNRRSDPGLVRAVNALFSRRDEPFLLDGIRFDEAIAHEKRDRSSLEPPLEVVFIGQDLLAGPLEAAVAPIVSREIAHLLSSEATIEGRPIEPGDIAVLCRSNKQAVAVTKALRGLNVPTSLDGDASVLNTEVAVDLRMVLEATLMPGDSPTVRRALLTPLIGVPPAELATMSDEAWSGWVSRFRGWNETWHSQGVVRFLEDMLRDSEAETRIAATPTALRDLTDLLHLEELLMRGERERGRDPIALMQWFRRLDEGTPDEGAVAYEDLQQRPDAGSAAVRVSTIHKSKGLEYGVVYCPFTWRDALLHAGDMVAVKFHDPARKIKLDLGSSQREAHLGDSQREAASEAIRLLYVAITRAKHHCVLFWGRPLRWKGKDSALAHLLHGEDHLDSLDEAAMRADLDALASASGGAIRWRPPLSHEAPARTRQAPSAELRARHKARSFEQAPRIASFSSLTGFHAKLPAPRSGVVALDTPSPLFPELPGGARTGLLLHAILEHASFSDLAGADTERMIESQLRAHGLDPNLAGAVQRDLLVVAETPLTEEPSAPRLVDLHPDRQLRELEFTLHADHANLQSLARLLAEHGAPEGAPRYPDRLAEVGMQTLRRFLRGYIDLVFEWRGRWYVADYKSNMLPSYDPASIAEAAQSHHYLLQAQLYTAAVHRHLEQRLSGYDPAKDWGGAALLFLRGMRGSTSAGSGVFFDHPSRTWLEALDRWLGGTHGSR